MRPKIGGLAIGLAVAADILVGGPLTGAAMNPARWFGPAVAAGAYADWYVWWIGPAIGAAAAALVYRTTLAEAARDEKGRPVSGSGPPARHDAGASGFDGGAGLGELGLDGLRLLLGDALLDRLRRGVDQVLGLLEAQPGQLADRLDDQDLVRPDLGQHGVELGLLLGRRRVRRRRPPPAAGAAATATGAAAVTP